MAVMTRSATLRAKKQFELDRKDPNKFVYFRFLPTEIRMDIWAKSRPEGRYIQLKLTSLGAIYSPAKVPSLLQACHESRLVARGWYRLAFATKFNDQARTYFDPTRDGIYAQCFNREDCGAQVVRSVMTEEGVELIKRMVWEGPLPCLPLVPLSNFGAMKDAILVRGSRIVPCAEVTLAEMTINTQPLCDDDRTTEEHWLMRKEALYELLIDSYPERVQNMMALESITRMDLAGLPPCSRDDICRCCY